MGEALLLEGKRFISSPKAGRLSGYTHDYISRLCRRGKLPGKLVSRTWYVEEEALKELLLKRKAVGKSRKKELSEKRKREYKEIQIARKEGKEWKLSSKKNKSARKAVISPTQLNELANSTAALSLAFLLIFGAYFAQDTLLLKTASKITPSIIAATSEVVTETVGNAIFSIAAVSPIPVSSQRAFVSYTFQEQPWILGVKFSVETIQKITPIEIFTTKNSNTTEVSLKKRPSSSNSFIVRVNTAREVARSVYWYFQGPRIVFKDVWKGPLTFSQLAKEMYLDIGTFIYRTAYRALVLYEKFIEREGKALLSFQKEIVTTIMRANTTLKNVEKLSWPALQEFAGQVPVITDAISHVAYYPRAVTLEALGELSSYFLGGFKHTSAVVDEAAKTAKSGFSSFARELFQKTQSTLAP